MGWLTIVGDRGGQRTQRRDPRHMGELERALVQASSAALRSVTSCTAPMYTGRPATPSMMWVTAWRCFTLPAGVMIR